MYNHSIALDEIAAFSKTSRRGFVERFNAETQSFVLSREMRAWLAPRPHCVTYNTHDGGYLLTLHFSNDSDMLMFKLTWGGR